MNRRTFTRVARALLAGSAAALLLAAPRAEAGAQTTTGLIRGYVTDENGAPVAEATVLARSPELNAERGATTDARGFYTLPGLRPGTYELLIRRIGYQAQTRAVQVMIGQTLTIDFRLPSTATQLEAVVTTAAPSVETRTSEVATNVSREQIDELPSSDRNFLALAQLAPGVQLQNSTLDGQRKTFSGGAQPPEQVNVFIDGASYKNDMLQGGVIGQDASRGNPFPRNAVQEFRIITQNFKAEYQKAASSIITATTRSGGSRWEGGAFFSTINERWVELDPFQENQRNTDPDNFRRPDFDRYQAGAFAGGPLGDRVRVFGSFEVNDQQRIAQVNIQPPTGFPALDTVNFAQYNGAFGQPFRSNLFFGKLTFDQSANSTLEVSYTGRDENDLRDFGGNTAFQAGTSWQQAVHTGIAKHTYARGNWLNEGFVSYQYYNYAPRPLEPGPISRLYGFGCCATIGSNISFQDFTQKRLSVRDDVTWSGWQWAGSHVVKTGLNVDFTDYDISKRNSEIPRFVYEPWFNDFEIPQRVEFQYGDPNFGGNNTQVGLYVQDDWSPTQRLVVNLGVRWDYETAMMNYDWETPQAVVDSLTKYEDLLFIDLDPDRYFTDGDDRSPFLGAIQPRVGASYALDAAGRTTLFGGWGIFYDRNIYDIAIEEQFALQHPSYRINFVPQGATPGAGELEFDPRYLTEGLPALLEDLAGINALNPEVKLLPNDLEPPMSQQFSFGVRQVLGTNLLLEAAYNGIRSRNIPTFYFANMNFTCEPRTFACFQENRIPGYSTILLLDDAGRTWYDALVLKLDRPYVRSTDDFGWGGGISLAVAERETQGYNDLFSFPNPEDYPRQKRNDEDYRVVMHWITDMPYLWGIQFSGLINLGSGIRYDRGDRFAGNFEPGAIEPEKRSFIIPNFWGYRKVDLHLRKDFLAFAGNRLGVTVDVFNVFDYENFSYNNTGGINGVVADPRHFQLGLEYDFGTGPAMRSGSSSR